MLEDNARAATGPEQVIIPNFLGPLSDMKKVGTHTFPDVLLLLKFSLTEGVL